MNHESIDDEEGRPSVILSDNTPVKPALDEEYGIYRSSKARVDPMHMEASRSLRGPLRGVSFKANTQCSTQGPEGSSVQNVVSASSFGGFQNGDAHHVPPVAKPAVKRLFGWCPLFTHCDMRVVPVESFASDVSLGPLSSTQLLAAATKALAPKKRRSSLLRTACHATSWRWWTKVTDVYTGVHKHPVLLQSPMHTAFHRALLPLIIQTIGHY
jgi:hypothetical protein